MNPLLAGLLVEPLTAWLAAAALLLALVAGLVLVRRVLFLRRLRAALANPALAEARIRDRYSPAALLRRSSLVEKVARHHPQVVALTGLDDLWISRLKARGRGRDLARVLRFAPAKGLFAAFEVTLARPRLAPPFMAWLEKREELLQVRAVALAGGGRTVDGAAAHAVLAGHLEQLWELAGDPEWQARYFATQVLLHDTEPRSQLALRDALDDAHPLVRREIAAHFAPADGPWFQERTRAMVLRDPALEVRQTAWNRLREETGAGYLPDPHGLEETELLHLLELLQPGSPGEEEFAFPYLTAENPELRLPAALLLERSGALERLVRKAELSDRRGLERTRKLLAAAIEVDVGGFLDPCIATGQGAAPLLLCARLVHGAGQLQHLVPPLARRVFSLPGGTEGWPELHAATLDCIAVGGEAEALGLMADELERRRGDPAALERVLRALPGRGALFFLEPLMALFRAADPAHREPVREALQRMPAPMVIPRLVSVLQAPRGELPVSVRTDAVRLLAGLEVPYCLEMVLENLWMLPPEDAKAVMQVLPNYPRKLLAAKVKRALGATDSRMRAAIIQALPATGDKGYLANVRVCLKDVEPDVRIAAIWALTGFAGFDWSKEGTSILEDPVERVRTEAAMAVGTASSTPVLKALKQRIDDPDESVAVQLAAIQGLERSSLLPAVDMLVACLEREPALREAAAAALRGKVAQAELTRLFKCFKDAEPALRITLTGVFRNMGEPGGQAMAELLKEDIASLRPHILEVLDTTGHVAWRIRRLSHRDAEERRAAAAFLTDVGTLPALRGLVLAAKDPDEQVRVAVVRALERLAGDQGRDRLQSLQQDPSRKVRRYTHWALERVRAKAL